MSEPPYTIVREVAQPSTGAPGPVGLRRRAVGSATYTGSLSFRGQYIVFAGELNGELVELEVLAGDGSPTPSNGYAKWVELKRPQRKSLTILEGYEPFTLTVPILFDAVRENGLQEDVENKIQWLEWMAGRGIKATKGFTAAQGKPPLVQVYAAIGNNKEIPLIPKPFQTPSLKWFIEDIQWAERFPEVMRAAGGSRIRQAAVVRLVEHVVDRAEPGKPKEAKAKVFTITKYHRTVQGLVSAHLAGPRSRLGEAVAATLKENAGNKRIGSSPEKVLKVGTKVKIPTKYLRIA